MFIIDHKRGDTISWEGTYTDDLGGVVNLTTYSIKCQARSKENKDTVLFTVSTEDNSIDKYNATLGLYRIVLSTITFPIGRYLVDIEYQVSQLIKSSETFELNIIEDITK